MGTDDSRVSIAAATLAGASSNDDCYAFGEGWAFVLDGASVFAADQPTDQRARYAAQLRRALAHHLDGRSSDISHSVAHAIHTAAIRYPSEAVCPTSTVAAATWNAECVHVYVLGDSTAAVVTANAEHVTTDDRLVRIAPHLRHSYRARLARGGGFDNHHRRALVALQAEQAAMRNTAGGYWIAGADPSAALNGYVHTVARRGVLAVVLATDGAAAAVTTYGQYDNWRALASDEPASVVRRAHDAELTDPDGRRWPRSNPHDDKTLVIARLTSSGGQGCDAVR
jgi:serine/threonine protein phosphatase PrpC